AFAPFTLAFIAVVPSALAFLAFLSSALLHSAALAPSAALVRRASALSAPAASPGRGRARAL
ncbi:hypothetical protein, partial [Streptomyces misionensis]|uniref:hypothetical protein n=1 Tax=Streptomyces misionensis TaxID=67331 RepID=UPI0016448067